MDPYNPAFAGVALQQDAWLTQGVLVRRLLGWAIDALILSVLFSIAWSVTALFGILTLGLGMPLMGLLPALPFVYAWAFLASGMAATPGQAIMGLTVRRDEDLERPTGLQALAFVLAYCATIALGAIWLAVALFTVRKRAPHDLISGLVVVRARALT
jgi:uncharacterized RDD family membrane protein YckC